jgi:hypothetical protein
MGLPENLEHALAKREYKVRVLIHNPQKEFFIIIKKAFKKLSWLDLNQIDCIFSTLSLASFVCKISFLA